MVSFGLQFEDLFLRGLTTDQYLVCIAPLGQMVAIVDALRHVVDYVAFHQKTSATRTIKPKKAAAAKYTANSPRVIFGGLAMRELHGTISAHI